MPLLSAAGADAPKTDDSERARVESIVHDYLMKNPKIILEAVQAYQDQVQAEKDKAIQEAVQKRAPDLLHDPQSQVLGNPKGDCVLIEFFDNQCPYCKANEPEIQKFLKEDGRVKLILKEFPILGPTSLTVAKAALASAKQGKYEAFHEAMLAHRGPEDEDAVDQVGKSVGADLGEAAQGHGSAPEIAEELDKNLELGRTLKIDGTPGFVIGDQIVPGLSKVDDLKKLVADACPKKS